MKELTQFFDMQINKENLKCLEQQLTKSNKNKSTFFKTLKLNKKKVLIKFYTLQDVNEQITLLTCIFRSVPRYSKVKPDLFLHFSSMFYALTSKDYEKNALILLQKINQNNPVVFGYKINSISINKMNVNDTTANFLFFNTNDIKIVVKNVYYVSYASLTSYQFTESLLCLYLDDKVIEIEFLELQKHEIEKIIKTFTTHNVNPKNSTRNEVIAAQIELCQNQGNICIRKTDTNANDIEKESKTVLNNIQHESDTSGLNNVDEIVKRKDNTSNPKKRINHKTPMNPVKTQNTKFYTKKISKSILESNSIQNDLLPYNTPEPSKIDIANDESKCKTEKYLQNNINKYQVSANKNIEHKEYGKNDKNIESAITNDANVSKAKNNDSESHTKLKHIESNRTSNEQNERPKTPRSTENKHTTNNNMLHKSVNISPCFKLIMNADLDGFKTSSTESEQAIHSAFNFSNDVPTNTNVFDNQNPPNNSADNNSCNTSNSQSLCLFDTSICKSSTKITKNCSNFDDDNAINEQNNTFVKKNKLCKKEGKKVNYKLDKILQTSPQTNKRKNRATNFSFSFSCDKENAKKNKNNTPKKYKAEIKEILKLKEKLFDTIKKVYLEEEKQKLKKTVGMVSNGKVKLKKILIK
ncbi:hypothetical protein BDAP_001388 [Binucleata daphniae]